MIWHLLPLSAWRSENSGIHLPGTVNAHPFVHASPDEEATLAVANALYRDIAEPMVALVLDTGRIAAPVRFEAADPRPPAGVADDVLFPHIYGPVETAAVTEIRYARRDPSGRYVSLDVRPAIAETLDLLPHPEGGWFRETWAAAPRFKPSGYSGTRAAATAIYFLLPPGARSQWHTVASDELWLWHSGGPLTLLLGGDGDRPAGESRAVTLGPDLARGQNPQILVPAGTWQSAFPAGSAEVLVTCVVAPGFDFADFTTLPD
ncbi:MAG: cupin domain-containing protein [Streptosporangiaceae bacterium]